MMEKGKGKNVLDRRKSLTKPWFERQHDAFEEWNIVQSLDVEGDISRDESAKINGVRK